MNTLSRLLLAASLAGPALLLAEDRISLADGSSLQGTVRSIAEDGTVVINSDLSPSPISLRGESLRSINFDIAATGQQGHPELLHLVNGDVLPCTLQALDGEMVELQTWYAGEIRVPRRVVDSIDFGVIPQRLVYRGPKDRSEWSKGEGWEFEDGKLVCDVSGSIARPKILPEQFILSFRIEWESNPNFRIYFCDDHLEPTGNADRYYFEVNSAGLQLKRQTSESDRRWFNLASSSRRPEEFPARGIDVEIRVDRVRRLLYLYLNDEKLGRYPDPIDSFPTGTGIMLQSQGGGDLKNIVPRIEIYEWDAVSQLRRSEGHDDPKTDAVVDVSGEHISGNALRLEQTEGTNRIVLDSPYSDDLLSIRTTQISSLYFKSARDLPADSSKIQFELRGGGLLHLTSLTLGEQTLSANHPLLGALTLQREALKQLFVNRPDEVPNESDQ